MSHRTISLAELRTGIAQKRWGDLSDISCPFPDRDLYVLGVLRSLEYRNSFTHPTDILNGWSPALISFRWRATPEGIDYWRAVWSNYRYGTPRLTDLPLPRHYDPGPDHQEKLDFLRSCLFPGEAYTELEVLSGDLII